MDAVKERESIPDFTTVDDIAQFWDTHSAANYEDLTHEVQFEVKFSTRWRGHKAFQLRH